MPSLFFLFIVFFSGFVASWFDNVLGISGVRVGGDSLSLVSWGKVGVCE